MKQRERQIYWYVAGLFALAVIAILGWMAATEPKEPDALTPEQWRTQFSRQFGDELGGGASMVEALQRVADRQRNESFRRVVADVRQSVLAGSPLSAGLMRHPQVFDQTYVTLIRQAETTGSLSQTLIYLAEARP